MGFIPPRKVPRPGQVIRICHLDKQGVVRSQEDAIVEVVRREPDGRWHVYTSASRHPSSISEQSSNCVFGGNVWYDDTGDKIGIEVIEK